MALARVLSRSFRLHHPGVPFFVLLADEVEGCFDPGLEPFELVALDDLDLPQPDRLRFRYAKQPFSYACTPWLLQHLLARGFQRVLFFKQESLVLAPMDDAIERLDRCAVLLTPHLVAPLEGSDGADRERIVLLSGVFNVGFVGMADRGDTSRLLSWWGERTSTGCLHAVDRGMHFEQRWLDLAPGYFEGVEYLRDPAYNVAHWNLPERRVVLRDGVVCVGDRRCRLFRFSGYDPERPEAPTRYFDRLRMEELGDAAEVFATYRHALMREGYATTATWPYAFGCFDDGVAIPDVAREIYRDLEAMDRGFDAPFATTTTSFYRWLLGPASPSAPEISRLWYEVHRRRWDLAEAFPDPLGRDRQAFVGWIRSSGLGELDLPTDPWGPPGG
jgi:hypothetical protein